MPGATATTCTDEAGTDVELLNAVRPGENPDCTIGEWGCNCRARGALITARSRATSTDFSNIPGPREVFEAEFPALREYSDRAREDERRNGNFFGVTRTVRPANEAWNWRAPNMQQIPQVLRQATATPYRYGFDWGQWNLSEPYTDRDLEHLAYAQMGLVPYRMPAPDTWPLFLRNWAEVGAQHERRVNCQPLIETAG